MIEKIMIFIISKLVKNTLPDHFVRKITFAAKYEDGEYRENFFPQSYNYILSI